MEENRYFKEALSGFTSEAAYGRAVRHLYDLGYSEEKIQKELAYPASLEQIKRVIEEYEKKKSDPDLNWEFVEDVDARGKKSWRRVKKTAEKGGETALNKASESGKI